MTSVWAANIPVEPALHSLGLERFLLEGDRWQVEARGAGLASRPAAEAAPGRRFEFKVQRVGRYPVVIEDAPEQRRYAEIEVRPVSAAGVLLPAVEGEPSRARLTLAEGYHVMALRFFGGATAPENEGVSGWRELPLASLPGVARFPGQERLRPTPADGVDVPDLAAFLFAQVPHHEGLRPGLKGLGFRYFDSEGRQITAVWREGDLWPTLVQTRESRAVLVGQWRRPGT